MVCHAVYQDEMMLHYTKTIFRDVSLYNVICVVQNIMIKPDLSLSNIVACSIT